ncbi:MAG: FagA protein [Pseudomonadota bacterium]
MRRAIYPDNPGILTAYLSAAEDAAADVSCSNACKIHARTFDLLLTTVCDPLLPTTWRWLCLDYMYKPLCALQALASHAEAAAALRTRTYHLQMLSEINHPSSF